VKGSKDITSLAKSLGVSRSTLYYASRKEESDWEIKTEIEKALRKRGQRAYGSRRLADNLGYNRKRMQRIMRKYGIKPHRRRGSKYKKKKETKVIYPNMLFATMPVYPNHIWAADFTELSHHGHTIYTATVIDLYTRRIIGIAVSIRKGVQLVIQALYNALLNNPAPDIFHSDNGTEYDAKVFKAVLEELNISISRSHPGCPWENGYQESFYNQFKIELGDPNRCKSLGELVAEIYRTVWYYNNVRIHSAIKMPPEVFANQIEENTMKISFNSVS
jgi:putative transposase